MKASDFIAAEIRLPDDANHVIWPPDLLLTYIGDGVRFIQSKRVDLNLIDNGDGTFALYDQMAGTPDGETVLPLPDIMLPALSTYVVHRAFDDESTAGKNPERAMQAWQTFRERLSA